ncbi:hypothetical protein O181_104347 [Austropuccinia psidii MF-1]|uniref:Uncharacterized protein n=1 Tax=Austropuccinia psidii MF-1 TaxID=1389203 RepID=A0A9Q3JMV8_9BASI|nr:hypothetical protein [Austropuccinia psidii MF-1]
MKESAKPPDNLPKSDHSFFKMVQSLLYPANPVKRFWASFMFETISLVSYNVIAPKPYVALTSNSTDPLGLERGAVEYLASCLSKLKQRATQLSIEGGRADCHCGSYGSKRAWHSGIKNSLGGLQSSKGIIKINFFKEEEWKRKLCQR